MFSRINDMNIFYEIRKGATVFADVLYNIIQALTEGDKVLCDLAEVGQRCLMNEWMG